ncbi:MAG: alcohol dehydrogenase catalytic domain-containing protein, partial [Roseibium sp.]
MKAVGYTENGAIDRAGALIDLDIDKPTADGLDILVKVEAVSVNPVDTKIRTNRPAEVDAPAILGWDAVGEVVEAGDKTSRFKVGDKV